MYTLIIPYLIHTFSTSPHPLVYSRTNSSHNITIPTLTHLHLQAGDYDKTLLIEGVLFITYSMLIAKTKNKSRLNQVVRWLGSDFDGLIVFDEAHKAKNLGQRSQMGLAVEELQNKCPNARIVYCSATGASEPANMCYMGRLGMCFFPLVAFLLHMNIYSMNSL